MFENDIFQETLEYESYQPKILEPNDISRVDNLHKISQKGQDQVKSLN